MSRPPRTNHRDGDPDVNKTFAAILQHRHEFIRRLAARFGESIDGPNLFGTYLLDVWERWVFTGVVPVNDKAYTHRSLRYLAISELRRRRSERRHVDQLAMEFDDGHDRNRVRRSSDVADE